MWCMCRDQRPKLGVFPISVVPPPPYFGDNFTEPRAHLSLHASFTTAIPSFYMDSVDPNPVPQTCTAITLPTEPSPQTLYEQENCRAQRWWEDCCSEPVADKRTAQLMAMLTEAENWEAMSPAFWEYHNQTATTAHLLPLSEGVEMAIIRLEERD